MSRAANGFGAVLKARDLQTRLFAEYKLLDKANERSRANYARAEIMETKRRRAVTAARVRSQAAWQLGKALVTSVDECERLKRVSYQQAGHIINLGERVDKAEQLLKTSGYWPDITVTAPDVIRIGAMQ